MSRLDALQVGTRLTTFGGDDVSVLSFLSVYLNLRNQLNLLNLLNPLNPNPLNHLRNLLNYWPASCQTSATPG